MENNNQVNNENSVIKEILSRILSDPSFKEELLNDPEKALENYKLSELQSILIKSLEPEDIEELSVDKFDEYFSADAAVYTPDNDEGLVAYDELEDLDDFIDELFEDQD